MKTTHKSNFIASEQLKQLYNQNPLGLVATFINAILIALILWSETHSVLILMWLGTLVALVSIRFATARHFSRIEPSDIDVGQWRQRFALMLFLTGLVWGFSALLIRPNIEPAHRVFIAFVLGGMVAGCVGLYSAYLPAFFLFAVPALLPITVLLFSEGSPLPVSMGVMISVFGVVTSIMARRANRLYRRLFALEYDNSELIADLKQEIDTRKSAEEKLRQSKAEVETEVDRTTAELVQLNDRLREEQSEKRQTEAALEKSETQYREVLERISDIVFVLDDNGTVAYISPTVTEYLGYLPEELIGTAFFDYVPQEDLEEIKERFANAISTLTIEGEELRIIDKHGAVHWMRASSQVTIEQGKISKIFGILTDITQTKRLEDKLAEAQKMEAIGQLAGGIAHDLNNILSGIVTYPELLLMDMSEKDDLYSPLVTIRQSGRRAADIVQDLLLLSRRGMDVSDVVNINSVIADYFKTREWGLLLERHPDVDVVVKIDDTLLNVIGSHAHLLKIVMNLSANAAESMPDGGRLTFRTYNHHIEKIKNNNGIKSGDYTVLEVTDTGRGLTEAECQQIFEPFFIKKKMGRSGSGLGMSIVWSTVQEHGGHIEVESPPESGTIFRLMFPATRKETRAMVKEGNLREFLGNGQTIMVVDDIQEQRNIASALLSKLGYSVTSAESGEAAIARLRHDPVDMLILDMIMAPGIDGLDTFKLAKEIYPHQKAIIASGFSETDRVKEAKALGAAAYIRKPYTLATLAAAVHNSLTEEARRSSPSVSA